MSVETIPGHLERLPEGADRFTAEQLERGPRERILVALAETVAKRGYRGTTIENIVKRAGVSRGTFYEHFENRESCLLAGFEETIAELRGRVETAIAGEQDWPRQVVACLRTLLDYIAEQPAAARTYLVEIVSAGPEALKRYEDALQELGREIERGRAVADDARELPDTLEDSIVGGMVWMVHQRLVRGEADQVPSLLPTMIELALAPYLGDAEAAAIAAESTAGS